MVGGAGPPPRRSDTVRPHRHEGVRVTRTVGVAISVPEPWGSFLNRCRASAGDGQAAQIPTHITLLGPTDIDGQDPAEIDAHLAAVARRHEPFGLHLRGTGTFRPVTDVVFVAVVAGISECERLADAVRSGPLERTLRFPYHPHVTIAHDVGSRELDEVFAGLADFEAKLDVSGFTLFEHGADGYWRPYRTFRLGGGEPV